MINPQLLGYIRGQLQKNVDKEQIKSTLMMNGWLASDVDEGFVAVGIQTGAVPNAPFPSSSPFLYQATTMPVQKKSPWAKALLFIIIAAILGGGGWYAYSQYFNNNSQVNQPTDLPPIVDEPKQITTDPLIPLKNVASQITEALKITKLSSGNLSTADTSQILAIASPYVSASTLVMINDKSQAKAFSQLFVLGGLEELITVTFSSGNISPDGKSGSLIGSYTDQDGKIKTGQFDFVNENGVWKYDIAQTLEDQMAAQADELNSIPDVPQGTVDLAIVSMELNASVSKPPSYSDPNAVVVVKIKNLGTATIKKFDSRMYINQYSTPFTNQEIIKPGETTSVTMDFGEGFAFFAKNGYTCATGDYQCTPGANVKLQTGVGDYRFSFTIDPKHELKDIDQSNNTKAVTIHFTD